MKNNNASTNSNGSKKFGQLNVVIVMGLVLLVGVIVALLLKKYYKSEELLLPTDESVNTVLNLEFTNLSPLANGHYQGWIETTDEVIPLTKFNVNEESTMFSLDGEILTGLEVFGRYDDIERVFITVEANGDLDSFPSAAIILESTKAISSQEFDLEFTVADFKSMSGEFVLSTPTNGKDSGDEYSGIWFIDPSFSWITPSLDLPELPVGWVYRPWVFYQDEYPLSTGSFSSTLGEDNESSYSGKGDAYLFPGEDFLNKLPFDLRSPLQLNDGESFVIISIEPSFSLTQKIDNAEDEVLFPLWPLIGEIPEDAKPEVLFPLEQDVTTLPSGLGSITYINL